MASVTTASWRSPNFGIENLIELIRIHKKNQNPSSHEIGDPLSAT